MHNRAAHLPLRTDQADKENDKRGNSHNLCSLLLLLSMKKASPSVIARATTPLRSGGAKGKGVTVRIQYFFATLLLTISV